VTDRLDVWLRFLTRCGWLILAYPVVRGLVALLAAWLRIATDPIAGVR
jgi:hypothetical protein